MLDESPWLRDELLAKVDYTNCTPEIEKCNCPGSAVSNEQLGKRSNNTLPSQFAAKWTLDRDGLKWELLDAGWNVAAALLTRDDEISPLGDRESKCQCHSLGGYRAKMSADFILQLRKAQASLVPI